jgi:BirA family biotin operon repressor/biotin-[acetyl-CoA-carboxylase] ligase
MDPRLSLLLRSARHQPVSWDRLAAAVGHDPKRVAAAVDELARAGFALESHPMLGLRLVAAPPSLIADEIACDLSVQRVGRRVRCVQTATSTNDLAGDAVAQGPDAADGLAIFAEYQSAGRGRRGNRWLAPPHTSILCSVAAWVPQSLTGAATVTRAAAVAVAEAIEDACEVAVGIKWPNDLVIDDRKVGGILVESQRVAEETGPIVIGIGLNCTQGPEAFPPEVVGSVASLATSGVEVDRTLLARSLLERLDRILDRMAGSEGADGIHREASSRCRTLGRRISLTDGESTYSGEVIGLDPDYGLVLRLAEGGIRRFPAMTSHAVPEEHRPDGATGSI